LKNLWISTITIVFDIKKVEIITKQKVLKVLEKGRE
jgi:hypothetical protein